jgi:CBS domain-containing protein
MVQTVLEVMTPHPVVLAPDDTATEAARVMRERNIGDVIVMDHDQLWGIVTDRDIVVRALADGRDANTVQLVEICSRHLTGIEPSATTDDAIRAMREQALRRLPVIENGCPIGVVSIGDIAIERDPGSALADVSAAPPNT